jgi:hypothetical protein
VFHHRRTRSRRTHDRVGFAFFEDAYEPPRYCTRLIKITRIERRLRTASLPLIKLNLTPDTSQHLDTAHANAGPHLIDKTRDE